jgi:DNA-binding MarR family transcriptional regulator
MIVDEEVWRQAAVLRRCVQRLSRRLSAERSTQGLSLTKISVLGHLARQGDLTATELAVADRLRPQSLTRVLAELRSDGLVRPVVAGGDRRERRLRITEAGRAALAADMRQRDDWLAEVMAERLSQTERDLLALCAPLLERLSDPEIKAAGPEIR